MVGTPDEAGRIYLLDIRKIPPQIIDARTQNRAFSREADPVAVPLEQFHLQPVLKRAYLLTDGAVDQAVLLSATYRANINGGNKISAG